ncbi:MAG: hypothetical protein ABJB16_11915 [Saprospiraceae bacterium]
MKTKTIISFLIMIIGVTGLGFIAPWWAGTVWVVLIAAIMRTNKKQGMFTGAFAFGLVWVAMARYMSIQDGVDIISKTGTLLGGLSHQLMMVVTLVIAFITGILSGWLGSALGQTFLPVKREKV